MNIKFAGTAFKPELRYTQEGKAVFSTRIALYTGGSQEKGYKPSVWFKVIAFDDLAEQLNQSITEKARVTVTGDMQPYDEWTDREGNKRVDVVIVAREITQGDEFKPESLPDDVPF